MHIVTLMEDSCPAPSLEAEHGLSLYIETGEHRILADTGASALTLKNANALGIDTGSIDTVVLSHGHYDHSGGIMPFAATNPGAAVYLRRNADGNYSAFKNGSEKYIGIDRAILSLPRVVLTEDYLQISPVLSVFSAIEHKRTIPSSNSNLHKTVDGRLLPDDFSHEQCLVVEEGGKKVLISGCAHNGIENILDRFFAIYHTKPFAVISGFHLMKSSEYTQNEIEEIRFLGKRLLSTGIQFYTGHCTGEKACGILAGVMGNALSFIHPGTVIDL